MLNYKMLLVINLKDILLKLLKKLYNNLKKNYQQIKMNLNLHKHKVY